MINEPTTANTGMAARLRGMFQWNNIRTLILIWVGWAIVMISFQSIVDMRFQPDLPDGVLLWTANETNRRSQNDKPYLMEQFMNRQVAWDSEFYLSIAINGYDDPTLRVALTPDGIYSLNYAFFPLYPAAIKAMSVPVSILGKNEIATATLAGVLVSLLGTLVGMIALYDITRDELGDEGGLRTAFYLLIFPSSFFLAQVYTEGLFVGLAFGSLALAQRKQFLLAGILAMLATWTRATGATLGLPIAIAWLQTLDWKNWQANLNRQTVLRALPMFLPVIAYFIWHYFHGTQFTAVEKTWFGRDLFDIDEMREGLDFAWKSITEGDVLSRRVYYVMELVSVVLAAIGCLMTLRRYPGVALFGLCALIIPVTSGWPQSLIRYVIVVPSLFIFTSRLGRWTAFDRVWTVACILLLSMQAALFTFDMWVA